MFDYRNPPLKTPARTVSMPYDWERWRKVLLPNLPLNDEREEGDSDEDV